MDRMIRNAALAGFASLVLAGCNSNPQPAPGSDTAENAPAAGVTRQTPAPEAAEPPVTPMPAQTAIQSQPGPDGSQVDLMKVAVTGDILTVTMRCSSSEKINSESFRASNISVIDDATSQRIGILKDNEGNWLASNIAGDSIMASCEIKPGVIWAKFAAPSAEAKTVSINFPGVAPFDGIPVTR
ncbi:PBP1b-binding outer membrane lipoprotein LpoB [Novosphingobium chloroacetimidivorans]|uniref:PBP1b-binding outer membrane lipoprotein LpoB n=1 Tax=Novosphingobium chloroacetimidivorans TaxID=1428314 RepID=A0A7W7K840_9SPHN|nr:hypothetical protein [Novosphingobium chloroacetimidivorans]MBB4857641.1 PBP1b-binding outer membrane lipoprotein LpoB [Novosphingobium chloroacetimidivorans]